MQREFELPEDTFGHGNTYGSLPMIMGQSTLDGRAGGSSSKFDTTDEFSSSSLIVESWPERSYPRPQDQSPLLQSPSFNETRKTGLLSDIFLPTAPQGFGPGPSTQKQTVQMAPYYDTTIVTPMRSKDTRKEDADVVQNCTPRSCSLTFSELLVSQDPRLYRQMSEMKKAVENSQSKVQRLQYCDSVNGTPNQNQKYPSQHHVYRKDEAVQATVHNYDQILQNPQEPSRSEFARSSIYDFKHEEPELPVDPYLRAFAKRGLNDKRAARRS